VIRALWTGATGMSAQQFLIDNISNNLANVNTTGFKRQRVQFHDLYYQSLTGGQNKTMSVGSGVQVGGTCRDFGQGNFERTDDPLNVAIQGDGFFAVEFADGQLRYTRDGSFRLDAERRIVTSSGYPVFLEGGGAIPLEAEEVGIDESGVVYGKVNGTYQEFGRIVLTVFPNPAGLEAIGSNLFRETPQSGPGSQFNPGEEGAGRLVSGYVETSNVEIVTEMVNLIIAQRAFELNSKTVETADQMWGIANNIRR